MAKNPEITPDLLLAHAGFVRSLARQLLSDEALVEDVVQETYIRALQAGPRHKEALTAWLRAVTRNVAFKAMRSSRRRKRREHAAARDEGLPSTSELVQREQSLKSVVDSVLALPEHYRQVVMLRYFDDLPPRKIAVQLDLPVNTVRMRLHRALKQLRGALDREYGEPGAWCVGVAALAGVRRPEQPPPAAQFPTVAVGAVIGVAVCAALLFAWTEVAGDGETEIAGALPTSEGSASEGDDDRSTLAIGDERGGREELAQLEGLAPPEAGTEGEPDPTPASATTARVLVVDPAGAPVANATVFGELNPAEMQAYGRTGEDGSFSVDVGAQRAARARNRALPVLLGARAEGFAPSTVLPWRGTDELVRIVVRPGGAELSGEVLDPTGAPISGARIEVGDSYRLGTSFLGAQVLTGAAGSSGRLQPGQYSAPGRSAFIQRVEHVRGYQGTQTLSPEGELGRLLPPALVHSDVEGKWRVTGLEPEPTPVRVVAPGFAPRTLHVELAPHQTRTLTIELEPGARLVGQARREDGLAPGRSFIYVVGDENGARRSVRLDEDGRFALEDLPAGRVRVFAESQTGKLVTHSATTDLDLTAGDESTWNVLLTPRAIVLGALVDAQGRPLAGWRVQIRLDENPSRPIAEASTDAQGHFALQARPPFPAAVYVYHPGPRPIHPSRVVDELWETSERYEIRLTEDEALGGSVTGRIDASYAGEVDALTRVLLVAEGSRHVYSLKLDEDGVFRSVGMPGGRYWLVMPKHGIGWVREPAIELAPGVSLDLGNVRLPELGRLHLSGLSSLDAGPRLRLSRVAQHGFRLVLFEGRAHPPLELEMAPGTYTIERLDGVGVGSKPLEVVVSPNGVARANLSVLR